jgi:hypothetical protein
MKLREAIEHLEEKLESGELKDCAECEAEHRQLLEWLKDYQRIKEKFKWIPVKVRPTTEEDSLDVNECKWLSVFHLPDDGERILVSVNGFVDIDENIIDGTLYYLDSNRDWVDADAWMPLPEPYKESEQLEKGDE